ncbi:MAG: SMC family ATPase [archaeon]
MLLTSLSLENIRSYTKQTLTFSQGTTLLLGDIGSGKSTVLLAIEFALFGILRGENSGQLLLRHGCREGKVTLALDIDGKDVSITRTLKKTKQGIVQDTGTLSINGLAEQYTPLELKAHIIDLLGYPQEFIMKSNALLYRYTMYCPQEEMTAILHDTEEDRINTIRLIFNLDKYKRIIENAALVVRELKTDKAVLQQKTAGLDAELERLHSLNSTIRALDEQEKDVLEQKDAIANDLKDALAQLEQLERQHQQRRQLQQHLQFTEERLLEKEQQLAKLRIENEQLQTQHIAIPPTRLLDEVKEELDVLEQEQKKLLLKMNAASIRIQEKQQLLKRQAVSPLLAESRAREAQLKDVLKYDDTALLERKEHEHAARQARVQALQQQRKTLLDKRTKFLHMSTCPTCLQQLTPEHKQHVQQEYDAALADIDAEVHRLDPAVHLAELVTLRESCKNRAVMEKELIALQQRIIHYAQEEQHVNQARQEIMALERLLGNLHPEQHTPKLLLLKQEYDAALQAAQAHVRQEELMRRKKALLQDMEQLQAMLNELAIAKQEDLHALYALRDLPSIDDKRETQRALQRRHADLLAMQTGISKEKDMLRQQATQLHETVQEKQRAVLVLEKVQHLQHWLDAFFIPAVAAIEKHTLHAVHNHCQDAFAYWTGLMLDDVSVRLDEYFTPIIEQNGYESTIAHLSGGERTSIALAYRLALHEVINTFISTLKTKDVLILDEPTDGFSSEQLDKMQDIFRQLKTKQVILVSHEAKVEQFVDRIVAVEKTGHASNVIFK